MVSRETPPANDRRRASAVTPVEQLPETIEAAARSGRPVWVFPPWPLPENRLHRRLQVPRLEFATPGAKSLPEARLAVHEDALLALETGHEIAFRRAYANSTSNAQLRSLVAAALRDIYDDPLDSREHDMTVCGLLGFSNERTASDSILRGRKLWVLLAAWPWWALDYKGGRLPKNWRTLPRVAEAFAMWRSG